MTTNHIPAPLSPEREAEYRRAAAELDTDRTLSLGTWTASPVNEKSVFPPEQAHVVEDVMRTKHSVLRASVGVFGDERHAQFTAMAREAVPALLAELDRVRGERDELKQRVAEMEKDSALLAALYAGGVDNWEGYDDAIGAGDR
ncbi:hypothetical protein [Streptomyces antimycoticus]|uniref:hypothetical protein n=1 Tax=Streptomyces antimycoticus TaxID=68175 RepID=UPI00386964D3|nr:hypothetical protein OG751_04490 [Streptomyces antimycoticus]